MARILMERRRCLEILNFGHGKVTHCRVQKPNVMRERNLTIVKLAKTSGICVQFLWGRSDEYFNVSYLSPWLEHYASIIRNPWPGEMKSFIIARTNHLNRVIPKAKPEITHGKRTRNGIDLEGTAPVQVRFVRIYGIEYQPDWMGATHWKLTIPSAKQNKLTVLFLNYDKQTIGQDAIRLR